MGRRNVLYAIKRAAELKWKLYANLQTTVVYVEHMFFCQIKSHFKSSAASKEEDDTAAGERWKA